MTIYLDITQLDKTRTNTGIQRVIKEFLKRIVTLPLVQFKILSYNTSAMMMEEIDKKEIAPFLQNPTTYIFTTKKRVDIFTQKASEKTIFFDIDSPWVNPLQREKLYPILSQNGFKIVSFIYDMIPILYPQYIKETSVVRFPAYLKAVFEYANLILFDSNSAKNDCIAYKTSQNYPRQIPFETVYLGGDFLVPANPTPKEEIAKLLKKKYILFVGTLEPRKKQNLLLEAFETLAPIYKDLNLIFIGKEGWKVEELVQKIATHPLLHKQLFWLQEIQDDTLTLFYQNAFIVTYLSAYEGYGLPIAESLHFGNITVAFKNSSIYEVGGDFVEYVEPHTKANLIETLTFYYQNKHHYDLRKSTIKYDYKPITWTNSIDEMISKLHQFTSF